MHFMYFMSIRKKEEMNSSLRELLFRREIHRSEGKFIIGIRIGIFKAQTS